MTLPRDMTEFLVCQVVRKRHDYQPDGLVIHTNPDGATTETTSHCRNCGDVLEVPRATHPRDAWHVPVPIGMTKPKGLL